MMAVPRTVGGTLRVRLLVDLKSMPAPRLTWDVSVAAARGETVNIRWPDLSPVPGNSRLVLTDKSNGERVSMRTTTFYEFRSDGRVRSLAVTLLPAAQGRLRVAGLRAVPGRGGVVLTLNLSSAANVEVRVLTPTGRTVAILPARSMQPGINRVSWNARDAASRHVPPGAYLFEVLARDGTGCQSRAVTVGTIR